MGVWCFPHAAVIHWSSQYWSQYHMTQSKTPLPLAWTSAQNCLSVEQNNVFVTLAFKD